MAKTLDVYNREVVVGNPWAVDRAKIVLDAETNVDPVVSSMTCP